MKTFIIVLVVLALAVAAYFLWFAPVSAPSPAETGSQVQQPASSAPSAAVGTDDIDALTASVLQDGSADLTTPVDADPTLTQNSDSVSGQADTSFGANQF